MGKLDQLGKDIFTEETPFATGGAMAFEVPAELPVFEVRIDGLLLVRDPARLVALPPPWGLASAEVPAVVDLKMQMDHLTQGALELLLHRRQSWQAHQLRQNKDYCGHPPAWIVASNVPRWLSLPSSAWKPERLAPGCYALRPSWFSLLWIASNELPLEEANIPFLVTRRHKPLVEFCKWVARRRPEPWLMRVLQYVPMEPAQREDVLRSFPPTNDPELLETRAQLVRSYIALVPQVREELIDEGKVVEARKAVERVLWRRGLEVSAEQRAQIEACVDLAQLERWHDQAITAPSADDALR